jgi:hypothetical protein
VFPVGTGESGLPLLGMFHGTSLFKIGFIVCDIIYFIRIYITISTVKMGDSGVKLFRDQVSETEKLGSQKTEAETNG